jgi:hypothetical protein
VLAASLFPSRDSWVPGTSRRRFSIIAGGRSPRVTKGFLRVLGEIGESGLIPYPGRGGWAAGDADDERMGLTTGTREDQPAHFPTKQVPSTKRTDAGCVPVTPAGSKDIPGLGGAASPSSAGTQQGRGFPKAIDAAMAGDSIIASAW